MMPAHPAQVVWRSMERRSLRNGERVDVHSVETKSALPDKLLAALRLTVKNEFS
jgi:hypothetical protein